MAASRRARATADPDADETVGQRLARLRKVRNITQGELAARLGVTQPNISSYERDESRLNADAIIAVAKMLRVSADELLGLRQVDRPDPHIGRRFRRRLELIESLPKRDKDALARLLNAFLVARKYGQRI